jgi:hypothetical protein
MVASAVVPLAVPQINAGTARTHADKLGHKTAVLCGFLGANSRHSAIRGGHPLRQALLIYKGFLAFLISDIQISMIID